jgi:hypothetical protein
VIDPGEPPGKRLSAAQGIAAATAAFQ